VIYTELNQINNIINRLQKYSYKNPYGFTIELKNNRIKKVKPSNKKHYCIGVKKPLIVTEENRIIYYHENFKLLEYNHYIGGYYNKEKKTYEIELILILSEKQKSINTGKYYKQFSIYDLLNQEEIILSKC